MSRVLTKEAIVRRIYNDCILESEDVVVVMSEGLTYTLPVSQKGRKVEIYIEHGASVTVVAEKPICGGIVGARTSSMCNSSSFDVKTAGFVSMVWDGFTWRMHGVVFE